MQNKGTSDASEREKLLAVWRGMPWGYVTFFSAAAILVAGLHLLTVLGIVCGIGVKFASCYFGHHPRSAENTAHPGHPKLPASVRRIEREKRRKLVKRLKTPFHQKIWKGSVLYCAVIVIGTGIVWRLSVDSAISFVVLATALHLVYLVFEVMRHRGPKGWHISDAGRSAYWIWVRYLWLVVVIAPFIILLPYIRGGRAITTPDAIFWFACVLWAGSCEYMTDIEAQPAWRRAWHSAKLLQRCFLRQLLSWFPVLFIWCSWIRPWIIHATATSTYGVTAGCVYGACLLWLLVGGVISSIVDQYAVGAVLPSLLTKGTAVAAEMAALQQADEMTKWERRQKQIEDNDLKDL